MGLISRVSSRTYRGAAMGGSQSKKPAAAAATAAPADPNFKDEQLTQVAEGVHVGTFLLERSVLREQQQSLVNKDKQIGQYVYAKTEEVAQAASETLEHYKKAAATELGNKDVQLAEMRDTVAKMEEAYEAFKSATEQSTEELKQTYESKIQSLNELIDSRGAEYEAVYNKSFSESQYKYPVKGYSPVCEDRIAAIGRCYTESRGKTLNCSRLVDELQQCVDAAKQERL